MLVRVDLNPLAVDLAKLALWLETVAKDRPLTFLDHHLKHGNSLIGARLARLGVLHDAKGSTANAFEAAFRKKLPALLEPLAEIRDLPSESVKDMKEKAKRFEAYQKAVEPFRQLADLWTADATGQEVDADKYLEAVNAVDKPKQFQTLADGDDFKQAVSFARGTLHAFHWDLTFPEVFCDANGAPAQASGGFDAIIGNPPYEVLAEKESGTDWSEPQNIRRERTALHPSHPRKAEPLQAVHLPRPGRPAAWSADSGSSCRWRCLETIKPPTCADTWSRWASSLPLRLSPTKTLRRIAYLRTPSSPQPSSRS